MNDLDSILSEDPVIRPSSGFAARVMEEVRASATTPAPLAFPWRRFLPGAAVCAAGLVAAVVITVLNLEPAASPAAEAVARDAVSAALLREPRVLAALALSGSLLLAWAAVRLSTRPGQLSL